MICGGENGTSACHLAVVSVHGYSLSLSLRGSPPFHPMEVLLVLAMPVKKYLKWWAIQLAIQCTVDTMNYLEYFKSTFLNSMYKQGH